MTQFNKKGKYLAAEVRFRYNEREGVIELTSKDPDLSQKGFMHRIYPDTQAGKVILSELEKHLPELSNVTAPPSFPTGPMLLPDEKGEPFKIPLGTGEKNEEIYWDISKDTHALISGRAGAGKSIARTVIYRHLKKHKDKWDVWGLDLVDESRRDHLSWEMKNDPVGTLFATAQVTLSNIRKAIKNGIVGPDSDKRIMVIIENFGLLAGQDPNGETLRELDAGRVNILEDLIYISRVGRTAGVHLCIITQQVVETLIPSLLRHNITLRYALGKHTNIASLMTLDSIAAARLSNKPGQGVISTINGNEAYIQGYYPAIHLH